MTSCRTFIATAAPVVLFASFLIPCGLAAQSVPGPPNEVQPAPPNPSQNPAQPTPPMIDLNPPVMTQPTAKVAPPPAYFRAPLAKSVQPEYTPEARAAGLQGSVFLFVEVNPAGEIEKTEVVQSLGLGLDEKAIEAVKQAGFKPAASPTARLATTMQSTEVRFVLDPAGPWRLHRAGYHVNLAPTDRSGYTDRPRLTEYVSPATTACGTETSVVLSKFNITRKGRPENVELVGQPPTGATQAALTAIASWKFQPGKFNAKPRESSAMIELECRPDHATAPSTAEYRIGHGVTAPALAYKVEPEYSEEARRAKFQGTVVLSLVVDATGHAVNLTVVKPLGLGLDEKAMEAILQWRFRPGLKDGQPVSTQAQVEVNFKLF